MTLPHHVVNRGGSVNMMTPGNNVPKRLAAKAQLALRDEDPCKVAIPFWVREGPTMRGTHETSATKPRARRLGALGSRHRSGPDITRRAISDSSFLAASTDDGAERPIAPTILAPMTGQRLGSTYDEGSAPEHAGVSSRVAAGSAS